MIARIKCAVSRAEVERQKKRAAEEIIQRRERRVHDCARDSMGYRKVAKGEVRVESPEAQAIQEAAAKILAHSKVDAYGHEYGWHSASEDGMRLGVHHGLLRQAVDGGRCQAGADQPDSGGHP